MRTRLMMGTQQSCENTYHVIGSAYRYISFKYNVLAEYRWIYEQCFRVPYLLTCILPKKNQLLPIITYYYITL